MVAVVVVPEHLDGSAVAAQYTDTTGKKRWIQHAFADKPFDHTHMEHRTNQLRQVGNLPHSALLLKFQTLRAAMVYSEHLHSSILCSWLTLNF
jgi:hypothetical protein